MAKTQNIAHFVYPRFTRATREQMQEVPASESLILIATGKLVGEGFDFPRLDTLIMATPVAWKGVVEQYVGRLNREYHGKKAVPTRRFPNNRPMPSSMNASYGMAV